MPPAREEIAQDRGHRQRAAVVLGPRVVEPVQDHGSRVRKDGRQLADRDAEAARTVLARPADHGPLAALHDHFLAGLARRDPVTGLDDRPETLAFVAMVLAAPSLQSRLLLYQARAEQTLAEALDRSHPEAAEGIARLAAAQIVAVLRVLAEDNRRCLAAGATAAERHPGAAEAAGRAFALLRDGLTGHYG